MLIMFVDVYKVCCGGRTHFSYSQNILISIVYVLAFTSYYLVIYGVIYFECLHLEYV